MKVLSLEWSLIKEVSRNTKHPATLPVSTSGWLRKASGTFNWCEDVKFSRHTSGYYTVGWLPGKRTHICMPPGFNVKETKKNWSQGSVENLLSQNFPPFDLSILKKLWEIRNFKIQHLTSLNKVSPWGSVETTIILGQLSRSFLSSHTWQDWPDPSPENFFKKIPETRGCDPPDFFI